MVLDSGHFVIQLLCVYRGVVLAVLPGNLAGKAGFVSKLHLCFLVFLMPSTQWSALSLCVCVS